MIDATESSLQRLFMAHAIDLFQEAYMPYVLDQMRAHFGDGLNTHLRSLMKRNNAPIYVDFVDGQPRPDYLALIHLMTSDGGLRGQQKQYTPVVFAPHGAHNPQGRPVPVPSFKELRLIRMRRNALNHQGTLTGEMIIDSIERIIRMVAMLPSNYQSVERRTQLQLLLARAQSSEFEHQLRVMRQNQQQNEQEQRRQALIQSQQARFDQHAQQLHEIEQQIQTHHATAQQTQQALTGVQHELNQMHREHQLLVTGTATSLVEARQHIETRIDQLQQDVDVVRARQSPDPQLLQAIQELRGELTVQRHMLAEMRIEQDIHRAQIDELHHKLARSARAPWLWLVGAVLTGWLWYSGWLMWGVNYVQPYLMQLLSLLQ